MKGQDVLFSHKSDEYITPDSLFSTLRNEFNIQLDACTTKGNPLNAPKFYTREDNGLIHDWVTWTYCNPPYSEVNKWVKKAYDELLKGNLSILLLPVRTDTKWFHEYIIKQHIIFLKGRLKFAGTKYPAPFPSMVVIFG